MEERILMQALTEPPPLAASTPLPPAEHCCPKLFPPKQLPKPIPISPTPHPFVIIQTLPSKSQQQLPSKASPSSTPSTSSSPSTSFSHVCNSPANIPVLRTTNYNHSKRQQEESESRKACFNICKHCKLPETKDFGHSRHIGIHSVDTFCPAVEGKPYTSKEEWMKARKVVNPPKPKDSSGKTV